jgi:hypothetical protein
MRTVVDVKTVVRRSIEGEGLQLRQPALGPQRWSQGQALVAHCHRAGQRRIKAFHAVALVDQFLLADLRGVSVQDRDLLFSAVQIATDQDHEGGLLSRGAAALGLPERSNSVGPFS